MGGESVVQITNKKLFIGITHDDDRLSSLERGVNTVSSPEIVTYMVHGRRKAASVIHVRSENLNKNTEMTDMSRNFL